MAGTNELRGQIPHGAAKEKVDFFRFWAFLYFILIKAYLRQTKSRITPVSTVAVTVRHSVNLPSTATVL